MINRESKHYLPDPEAMSRLSRKIRQNQQTRRDNQKSYRQAYFDARFDGNWDLVDELEDQSGQLFKRSQVLRVARLRRELSLLSHQFQEMSHSLIELWRAVIGRSQ